MPIDAPSFPRGSTRSALRAALGVYVEPLASDARVLVLGDSEGPLAEELLELGARSVSVFDPDAERAARAAIVAPRGVAVRPLVPADFDLRDAAFDLALVPDLAALPDAASVVGRLRRVVDPAGAVVACARARTADGEAPYVFPGELAPSSFEYAELYDLFALRFEHVAMTGVLPFGGVVFAELGGSEDVAVSVDTRLGNGAAPSVFVVVAAREAPALDPYAIVQTPEAEGEAPSSGATAAYAAAQLRAELLAAQLEEQRARAVASARGEGGARIVREVDELKAEIALLRDEVARTEAAVARAVLERDAVGLRAAELEGALVQVQQRLLLSERRLAAAEQGLLERDDTIASLNAELDARAAAEVDRPEVRLVVPAIDPAVLAAMATRAERAEEALAVHAEDLGRAATAHAEETEALEAQLQERARAVAALESEVARRDQMVRELVAALEELRDGHVPAPPPAMPSVDAEELVRLRRKADELALEVARRESELVARDWRLHEVRAAERAAEEAVRGPVTLPSRPPSSGGEGEVALAEALARAEDEVAALRQALAQEHAARLAAESGEELERVRAEVARQAVLLEQLGAREAEVPERG